MRAYCAYVTFLSFLALALSFIPVDFAYSVEFERSGLVSTWNTGCTSEDENTGLGGCVVVFGFDEPLWTNLLKYVLEFSVEVSSGSFGVDGQITEVSASSPTGGQLGLLFPPVGLEMTQLLDLMARGSSLADIPVRVHFWARTIDSLGGESGKSNVVAVEVDRLSPQSPSGFCVKLR